MEGKPDRERTDPPVLAKKTGAQLVAGMRGRMVGMTTDEITELTRGEGDVLPEPPRRKQ